jgi:hypothetical protein
MMKENSGNQPKFEKSKEILQKMLTKWLIYFNKCETTSSFAFYMNKLAEITQGRR